MFKSVNHCFAVGDTIMGVIRKYNAASLDQVTRKLLMDEFNRLNGNVPPRPGNTLLIPIRDF